MAHALELDSKFVRASRREVDFSVGGVGVESAVRWRWRSHLLACASEGWPDMGLVMRLVWRRPMGSCWNLQQVCEGVGEGVGGGVGDGVGAESARAMELELAIYTLICLLGSCWGHFGVMLGSCWCHSGFLVPSLLPKTQQRAKHLNI